MVSSRDLEIIELWLAHQRSPHTRSCYRRDADRVMEKLRKPLHQIGLADLQSFADSLVESGLAPVSRLRTIAAVRSLFGFCQRTGYLPANPARELPLPSYENRLAERILPEEEVQRLLAAETGPRDHVLLNLIYIAGLRVSEACQLRWRNLRLREGRPYAGYCAAGAVVDGAQRPPWGRWRRRAGLPVAEPEALGPRARSQDYAPGGRTVRRWRLGQPALASPRPCQPCFGPRRSDPLGPGHARPYFSGNDQRVLACPPRRVQRTLPRCRKIVTGI